MGDNPWVETGALYHEYIRTGNSTSGTNNMDFILHFNASRSNAIYTDNGKVMPLSISKQSYIIYK